MSDCDRVRCILMDWHHRVSDDRYLGEARRLVAEEAGKVIDETITPLWRGPAIVGIEENPIAAERDPSRRWMAWIDDVDNAQGYGSTSYDALAAAWCALIEWADEKTDEA